MKRTVFLLATVLVVFVAVFAVLVMRPVRKVRAHTGCSNASLRGNYALVMSGLYYYDGYTWDFSMLANFDGQGNLSGSSLNTVYDGQNVGPEGTAGPVSFTGGTYHVNNDCTVCMTIPSGVGPFYDYEVYFNGGVTDTGGDEAKGTAYFDYLWSGTFDAKKVHEGSWNFLP